MADLTQQVKNHVAAMNMTRPKAPFVSNDKDVMQHRVALQVGFTTSLQVRITGKGEHSFDKGSFSPIDMETLVSPFLPVFPSDSSITWSQSCF